MQTAYQGSQRQTELSGPDIAKRINAILAERGIPKAVFYQACGISSGAFSQWRTGVTTPTFKNLARIATYLDVQLADLVGDRSTAISMIQQERKHRINHRYQAAVGMKDYGMKERSGMATILQEAKDKYGLMFDTSKGATEEEMRATIAFLRTLREQRAADED